MLSKSSARLFFIAGTLVFSLAFLALTFDTARQVPSRSHQDAMDEAVIRGHEIWTDNNCMGCHTLLGEGAYYAPELTKVVERRGREWIKVFIKDPQAMFPGRRKMVQYNFNDQEIDDLISFFSWIGNIDTNGFPPAPDLAPPPDMPAIQTVSMVGAELGNGPPPPQIFSTICVSCHALGGKGGKVGPALDGVSKRYTPEQLHSWLKNPQAYKPGTAMPNLQLTEETIGELVEYLAEK